MIEPCQLLIKKTNFFTNTNFQNLTTCLQSSYESIRTIAHEIIKNFDNFDKYGVELLQNMWS